MPVAHLYTNKFWSPSLANLTEEFKRWDISDYVLPIKKASQDAGAVRRGKAIEEGEAMRMPVTSRFLSSVEVRDKENHYIKVGVDQSGRTWGYVTRNIPVEVDYDGNAVTWGFNVCVMERDVWCYVTHCKTSDEALGYIRDIVGCRFDSTTQVRLSRSN